LLNDVTLVPIILVMGSRLPQRNDPRLERRVGLALLFVGALTCFFGGLMKADLTDTARTVQFGSAGSVLALGLLVLVTPGRRAILHNAATASLLSLGAMLATSNSLGPTAFFLLWPLVFLAYFSTRLRARIGLGLMVATVGVAAAVNPYETNRMDMFVGTVVSVGLMTGLVRLMTERELALRQALAKAADTDALTGLLNRRGIEPELERLLAAGSLAIVMVDLDHFKRYNDRHGHLVGDDALRRVASVLTAAAGTGDRVARFGGEEFTVALTGADVPAAHAYAARVMAALRAEDVADDRRLTVSAGIATLGPDGATVEALLNAADSALYRAKASGRDRVVAADGAGAAPLPRAA
jgi:diguanylate cyclase (GGDEF)-like protein